MTPEQRIAQLEAELARERERADGLQEIVHALAVKTRSRGAERQAAYRARQNAESVTSDVTVTHNSDASHPPSPSSSPPPPFSLPPPSAPSPSFLYPSSPASPPPPPRESRDSTKAQPAGKPSKPVPSEPVHGDPLRDAVDAVWAKHHHGQARYPWPADGEQLALSALLDLCGRGNLEPVTEIPRRFSHGLQRSQMAYQPRMDKAHTLPELVRAWNANAFPPPVAKPSVQGPATPSSFSDEDVANIP